MPTESTEFQLANFKPLELAARLMQDIRIGTLATLDNDGAPLATLTTIALDEDGVPLIFISSLSAHTQNLCKDARFSLLLAELGKGDPLAHPRVSLSGIALQTISDASKARFIEKNPKAKLYAEFGDFSLWRLVPDKIHLNGGFARAYSGDAKEVLNFLRK
jgi:heme iron utilization protein